MTLGNADNLMAQPVSLEAEQALLGALLASNKALDRVHALEPHHFADAVHGRIFAAIRKRVDAGGVADAVSLRQAFEHSDDLAEVGGGAYLAQLLAAMVSPSTASEYARLVRDLWTRRMLIGACSIAMDRCRQTSPEALDPNAPVDAAGILAALDVDLAGLSRDGAGGQDARSMHAVSREVMENFYAAAARKGRLAGITTGYAGLDRMLGGFQKGLLYLIAGRPAMGKTGISLGMTLRPAAEGARVFYASAEMDASQVAARAVAAIAEMPVTAALRAADEDELGEMRYLDPSGNEAMALERASRRLAQHLDVQWDDSPIQTVAGIRAKARLMQRKSGLDLVVVDYIGRLRASSQAMGYRNRVLEVGEIARDLKALARELAVPVVALSQLSREVEKREDKRPHLGDLRDSGELEQEADAVLFLYREHYYLKNNRPTRWERETEERFNTRLAEWGNRVEDMRDQAEIIVAKQRQGRTGPVHLRFDARRIWFSNTRDEPAVPGLPD